MRDLSKPLRHETEKDEVLQEIDLFEQSTTNELDENKTIILGSPKQLHQLKLSRARRTNLSKVEISWSQLPAKFSDASALLWKTTVR